MTDFVDRIDIEPSRPEDDLSARDIQYSKELWLNSKDSFLGRPRFFRRSLRQIVSDPWIGEGALPITRAREEIGPDDFRDKLIQSEYEFYRKEFFAAHNPLFVSIAFVLNVAMATYLWTNRKEIIEIMRLETLEEFPGLVTVLLSIYTIIIFFSLSKTLRSALPRRKWIEAFSIETCYDKALNQYPLLSQEGRRLWAKATVIDTLEQRLQWLREASLIRRASHRSANRFLIASLIFGVALVLIQQMSLTSTELIKIERHALYNMGFDHSAREDRR